MTAGVVSAFDFAARPRIISGPGVAARLGALARELGASRVLLVTDPGIVSAGHAARLVANLQAAEIAVEVFDRVRENPGTREVDACLIAARAFGPDAIVAAGGGSSLDTAKGCNFLYSNGGKMRDYWHTGAASKPFLPLIAVPTTAGTGSECQSFALIVDEESHQKMACGDPKALARIALLDPELTLTQPRRVAALTGFDALVHALETAVTTKRTPVSSLFAREAFALIQANLPRVLETPSDLDARQAIQVGAAWAGVAIEHSMLGATHACANPLTIRHGILHGQAVGMMLPSVLRFNAGDPATAEIYAALAVQAGLNPGGTTVAAVDALISRVEGLARLAGLPSGLADCGVAEADLPALVESATTQWTGRFNPRPVDREAFLALYRAALHAA